MKRRQPNIRSKAKKPRLSQAAKAALEEREYWQAFGARYGLGRLYGWSYKHSASFITPRGFCLDVHTEWKKILEALPLESPAPSAAGEGKETT